VVNRSPDRVDRRRRDDADGDTRGVSEPGRPTETTPWAGTECRGQPSETLSAPTIRGS